MRYGAEYDEWPTLPCLSQLKMCVSAVLCRNKLAERPDLARWMFARVIVQIRVFLWPPTTVRQNRGHRTRCPVRWCNQAAALPGRLTALRWTHSAVAQWPWSAATTCDPREGIYTLVFFFFVSAC